MGLRTTAAHFDPVREPQRIAIIGIGCRLPGGVRDLASLGRALDAGRDVLTGIPLDRWDSQSVNRGQGGSGGAAGSTGAFLDDVARFDAEFFGISPAEAGALDPQQRLLLEVGWEAMADSGYPSEAWRGSRTGVFVGMLAPDYAVLHAKTLGIEGIDDHYATGNEFSFGSGRLAYVFDLHGPVLTLNTACSSALVAMHLACQSLRSGDCDTALVGGVNLLLSPELSVFMNKIGATSPSGHCRPFDAAADGVVRGEGCGFVILKRLTDARADSDRVRAVIRGSAVNHGGATLSLTMPSPAAQSAVLRSALGSAGLDGGDVDYVEAHGTGTPLGDRVELAALAQVYGAARAAGNPLPVGSHKAVFGHADAAAGMTGLLKAIWVVNSGRVPAQPGFGEPVPALDWDRSGITIPASGRDITADRPLRAGVSAFGLSGANAHLIVEADAPAEQAPADLAASGPHVLLVSTARHDQLGEQLGRARSLAAATDDLSSLVASAATRRGHEAARYAVVAEDREGLLAALAGSGRPAEGGGGVQAAYEGFADPDTDPVTLFVYSGQGCQWPGMAADLLGRVKVVTDALDECDALIRRHASWSLIDEIRRTSGSALSTTNVAQPAIFAVQVALSRWLAECGVTPDTVVGHSMGEIAAAHVAGCLSLAEAVRLIVCRGEILHSTAGNGRMMAVRGSEEAALAIITDCALPVWVATVNGPEAIVLAGRQDDLAAAALLLEQRGLRCTPLTIDYAFHSPIVAACGPRLRAAMADLAFSPPSVRLLSSVDPATELVEPSAGYWGRNVSEQVRLWPAVDRVLATGNHAVVEIGPDPILGGALRDAVRHAGRRGPVVGTLSRGEPGQAAMRKALAQLHVAGVTVGWEAVTGRPSRYHDLPIPSWGGDRHWLRGVRRGQQAMASSPAAVSPRPGPAAVRVTLLDDAGDVLDEMVATPGAGPSAAATADRQATEEHAVSRLAAEGPGASPSPPQPAGPAAAGRPGLIAAQVGETPPDIAATVEQAVRKILRFRPDRPVPHRRGLFEVGLDSVGAIALLKDLEDEFDLKLPENLIFDHPTVRELAGFLRDASARPAAPAAHGEVHASVREEDAQEDADGVAVVGLACRLPGAACADEFWSLLAAGQEAIGELPADRRSDPIWSEADPGVPTRGGFLDDVAGFDAAFFRISPREARSVDPQQRLLLEVGWEALEDSGESALRLQGRAVGVYVGLNTADYQQLLTRSMANVDLYYGTGTSFAAAAGRLSYVFGLRGPGIVVDSACSSSLTAVHLACQGLRDGDCEIALVGGANVIVTPTVSVSMSAAGALAPDGRCKTFDEAADGYGRGEGAVALVLKPLAAAQRDGNRVYAVIRGSAVNSDGASGGLTVPSGSAQTEVIQAALARAGWNPGDVDYVEAHGTGTPLGDPIEITALANALGTGRTADTPLLVGSVKPNIGHLEAAAGMAGLLKIILAMARDKIPPHRITAPSSRIDWAALPVALPGRDQRWPRRGRPGRAGVSAFGFTGSNAHVLVEQAPPVTSAPLRLPAGTFFSLPVTSASQAALGPAAARMADLLRRRPAETADIVCTAVYWRSWLDHRAVVVGDDAASLAEALEAVVAGDTHPHARLGVCHADRSIEVAAWYGDEQAALNAAELFAAEGTPARSAATRPPVSLPPYPWDRRRYWLSAEGQPGADHQAGPDGRDLAVPQAARVGEDPEEEGSRTFAITWPRIEAPQPGGTAPGSWIVIGAGRWADDVARTLGDQGHRIARATVDGGRGDWAAALTRLAADLPDCRGVLFVATSRITLGGDLPGAAGAAPAAPAAPDVPAALALGQAMAAMPRALGRLWFLTRGAQDPVTGTSVRPDHSALWELGRVLSMEMPGRWGGLLDVYGDPSSVAAALHARNLDDQVCVRGDQWYAARLTGPGVVLPRAAGPGESLSASPGADIERWHVVIGGSAADVAVRALARRGARRLLLVGDVTSPVDEPGIRAVERCAPDELDDRLADLGPLADVVAVAAPLPTTTLAETTQAAVAKSLADAARLASLCEITALHKPRSITLVMSAAPSWGAVGTVPVAAATGWLAGWARAARVAVRVVGLMPRAGTGELSEAHRGLFEESGLRLLTAAASADALARALAEEPAERYVASVDLGRYTRLCQELVPHGFLTALEVVASDHGPLYGELGALSQEKRLGRLIEHAAAVVAESLGAEPDSLDPDVGFFELGMDSVMALRVRVRLEDDLAIRLPATLTFEFPTVTALAAHLDSQFPASGDPDDDDGALDGRPDATDEDLMSALDEAMAAAERDLEQGGAIR